MKKYPKIFRLGHKENFGILSGNPLLVITEKLDGSNMRFWLKDREVHFGTRNVMLGPIEDIPKSHMHLEAAEWILDQIDRDRLNPQYTYFGEMMLTKHTLKYNKASPFMGFDIWIATTSFDDEKPVGRFMGYGTTRTVYDELGLPTIEPLYTGKDNWRIGENAHFNLKALISESSYADDRMMEGIVLKAYDKYNVYGRQLFAKMVREEFVEENKAAFKDTKRFEDKLLNRFLTQSRVNKTVNRLLEAGHELDMTLMKHLPKMVFEDIIEEEWREIVYERGDPIDFGFMRKKTAKRCAKILSQILLERAT